MKKTFVLLITFSLTFASSAFAIKKPIIFPKENQSKEQQTKDKQYCNSWAHEETGVDPSYLKAKLETTNENVSRSASGEEPRFGRRLMRGAALGAAMGGLDDAIGNDVGKRAAQGAVLMGAKTRQDKKQYYQQQELNSQLSKKQRLEDQYDEYMRAFSVCMDAKGYSVK